MRAIVVHGFTSWPNQLSSRIVPREGHYLRMIELLLGISIIPRDLGLMCLMMLLRLLENNSQSMKNAGKSKVS